jgi:signal peptidase
VAYKKKSGGTFFRIIIILLLIVLIGGVLVFNFFFKKDGTPSDIFGYYFLRTEEVFMVPEIMPGDMVIGKEVTPEELAVDNAVICRIRDQITVMRIIAVNTDTVPISFTVKYDTSQSEADAVTISSDSVIALAEYRDPNLGKILDFATSVPGILLAIMIPLGMIIAYQVVKLRGSDDDDEDPREKLKADTADIAQMLDQNSDSADMQVTFEKTPPREYIPEKVRPEQKLTVDKSGKADLTEVKVRPTAGLSAVNTYQKFNTTEPAVRPVSHSPEMPKPTKIDDLLREMKEDISQTDLKPYKETSAVIPEAIAKVSEEVPKRAGENKEKPYFTAPETPVRTAEKLPGSVPRGAVIPKENIAPVTRRKASKTLDDLMKIIDAEESKLKK